MNRWYVLLYPPYSARKHGGHHIGSVLCSIFRLSNSVRYHWHNTLAILVKMTSIICSVRGCHNHWNKRGVPLQQYCVVHGKTRAECCWASFNLHPPPSSDEDRRMWLEAPEPSEKTLLCSFHFVDGRPSDQHPYPEKWLGYVIPLAKKARRMLVRLQGKITF